MMVANFGWLLSDVLLYIYKLGENLPVTGHREKFWLVNLIIVLVSGENLSTTGYILKFWTVNSITTLPMEDILKMLCSFCSTTFSMESEHLDPRTVSQACLGTESRCLVQCLYSMKSDQLLVYRLNVLFINHKLL